MKRIILLSLMIIAAVFLAACTPATGLSDADSSASTDLSSADSSTDSSGDAAVVSGKVTTSSFAQCLTDSGAEMYGAEWCSHCKAQKKTFGNAFDDVFYIECTEEQAACDAAGITGYPTWVVDGQKYPGQQSFERLASLTGCEAPQA